MTHSKSISFSLMITALLSGCAHQHTARVADNSQVQGEFSSPFASGWLGIGNEHAMNVAGQPVVEVYGEYLDQRQQQGRTTLLTLDNQHRLVLLQQQTHTQAWHISTSEPLDTALEGLCLYQPQPQQPLQAFLLTEDSLAQQVILQPKGTQLEVTELRQLPLPPASEYCQVDDRNHQLYLTEEGIGLWRVNARAESELRREPIALVKPYGTIEAVGPLSLANNHLWMAAKGGQQLYGIDLRSQQVTPWSLNPELALDGLAIRAKAEHFSALVLDENSGQWLELSLPIAADAQAAPAAATETRKNTAELLPSAETTPVASMGDAADDPAIWVHPTQSEKSRILGTNKQRGLLVYDLNGQQLQQLNVGRVNNVDVRQGFSYRGQRMDIAAASQRDRAAIALFAIDPFTGELSVAEEITTTLNDVYGLCLYRGKKGALYAFINDEDGRYEQWHIRDGQNGWQGQKVREFALASQPEGCSADDVRHTLFLGEENSALYAMNAEPDATAQFKTIGQVNDGWLTADIEGMEIYDNGEHVYLLVSSQGDDSYVLYNALPPYQPLTRFRIGINLEKHIDGASETDGLTVTSANLGKRYEQGLIVVQDGRNLLPKQTQNFKLVPWAALQRLIEE
jgi:3-phytase